MYNYDWRLGMGNPTVDLLPLYRKCWGNSHLTFVYMVSEATRSRLASCTLPEGQTHPIWPCHCILQLPSLRKKNKKHPGWLLSCSLIRQKCNYIHSKWRLTSATSTCAVHNSSPAYFIWKTLWLCMSGFHLGGGELPLSQDTQLLQMKRRKGQRKGRGREEREEGGGRWLRRVHNYVYCKSGKSCCWNIFVVPVDYEIKYHKNLIFFTLKF